MNKTINRHLAKVVSDHQRDWDQLLHLFLLAYRSSVHESTGQSPASIIMGRELRLPCDLKFGCPPGEDVAGEDYESDLRRKMEDIHQRVRHNIQSASDRMKESYDIRAENGGFRLGNLVWLYNPQRRRGFSPKLQCNWEGPYEIIERINDVVYRIRKPPRGKPRVVHFNRLAPYAGNHDEEEAAVRNVLPVQEMTFDAFMSLYSNGQKIQHGVTREEQRDLFTTPTEYSLAHCVSEDLRMSKGIAATFKKKYGQIENLQSQGPQIGKVLQIVNKGRPLFYMVTKKSFHQKTTYQDLWNSLIQLRDQMLIQDLQHLAVPKIACGLDKLNWRVVRSMLEEIFRFTGIDVLVCCYNPKKVPEKTVDCYFNKVSRCKYGEVCRYRHGDISGRKVLRRGQCNKILSSFAISSGTYY